VIKGTSAAAFLNNGGDDIYLISNRTSVPPPVVHHVAYGASIEGSAWAAVPNGSENFAWRTPNTFCGTNGGGGDITPPATIANLAAAPGSFPGEVHLTWTAPGDDGATGRERVPDQGRLFTDHAGHVRRRGTAERGQEPVRASEALPNPDRVRLSPDTTYYFAIKTIDDAANASGVSNSPGTPPLGLVAESPIRLQRLLAQPPFAHELLGRRANPARRMDVRALHRPARLDFLAVTDPQPRERGHAAPNYHFGLSQADVRERRWQLRCDLRSGGVSPRTGTSTFSNRRTCSDGTRKLRRVRRGG
jgi:hypothetical protein